jgi:hypothetical protein
VQHRELMAQNNEFQQEVKALASAPQKAIEGSIPP